MSIGIDIDTGILDALIAQNKGEIEQIFENFPPEIKDQIEKLKTLTSYKPAEAGPITEEDKKKILEDIDKMFKQEPKGE